MLTANGITITPENVHDIVSRLNFLFFPIQRVHSAAVPFEFYPREDVCGIELRMFSVICPLVIKLDNEQVKCILKAACSGLESWASVVRTDLMRMCTKDGSDPRLIKPEELADE